MNVVAFPRSSGSNAASHLHDVAECARSTQPRIIVQDAAVQRRGHPYAGEPLPS